MTMMTMRANDVVMCVVMQLVWPGQDLSKQRRTRGRRSLPPITFTRCRCSTVEPVASAGLPIDSDEVTYFETYDGITYRCYPTDVILHFTCQQIMTRRTSMLLFLLQLSVIV